MRVTSMMSSSERKVYEAFREGATIEFMRWARSGYRNLGARKMYEAYREEADRMLAKVRRRSGMK